MLAEQTASVRRFGSERYTSTELDLLGNGIWRLLRRAERAEAEPSDAMADAAAGSAPSGAESAAEQAEAVEALGDRTVTFRA